MAMNTTNFVLQPEDQVGVKSDGVTTRSLVYKGEYDELKTEAKKLSVGEQVSAGLYLDSWNLRRVAADLGVLTLTCNEMADSEFNGVMPDAKLLSDVWSCRSVRNDVSIMAYCGDGASREMIESWMKEPDGSLAKQNKFRNSGGKEVEIKDNPTLLVMDKIRRGIESVMRFYPMITRTRTYTAEPEVVYENLARINTPPVPLHFADKDANTVGRKIRVPKGLAALVNNGTWLKCQDDINEQPDRKWVRTESWMGILTWSARDAWDPDLYGTRPWSMPLGSSGGSGS